jgi:hypothetical protein
MLRVADVVRRCGVSGCARYEYWGSMSSCGSEIGDGNGSVFGIMATSRDAVWA